MEAMWSRYLPAIRALRRALSDGAIGTVRKLEADIAWKHEYDPANRLFDRSQGGGALHDLGIYPISLARFFLGEPVSVDASWRATPSGVDIAATPVSYTHLRAHETGRNLVCRLLLFRGDMRSLIHI